MYNYRRNYSSSYQNEHVCVQTGFNIAHFHSKFLTKSLKINTIVSRQLRSHDLTIHVNWLNWLTDWIEIDWMERIPRQVQFANNDFHIFIKFCIYSMVIRAILTADKVCTCETFLLNDVVEHLQRLKRLANFSLVYSKSQKYFKGIIWRITMNYFCMPGKYFYG